MPSDALLASIYAIATDPCAFDEASQHLADELGYRYGLISIRQGAVPIEVSINQPSIITTSYLEHYFRLDPWTSIADRTRPGDVIGSSDADAAFYDTEFYVDFARPMGIVDPVGMRLSLGGGREVLFGMNQPLRSRHPTVADGRAVQEIGQHLQRALQLRTRFAGLAGARDDLAAALARLDFGMAIAASDGRIALLNPAAEQALALGCGLRVQAGILTTTDPSAAPVLARLVRDACNGGPGGALRVEAGEHAWLSVLVAPLPPQARPFAAGARALVSFRLPRAPASLDARLLMSVFGLSRVEAQVAIAIMDGLGLEEIAMRRGVKPSTVKTQLDAVFEKTDTFSQRALVRLLSSLPQIRTG